MSGVQQRHESSSSLPRRLDAASRTSSTSSSELNLVGHIESATLNRKLIFTTATKDGTSEPLLETPLDSQPATPSDEAVFDDDRLPLHPREHRISPSDIVESAPLDKELRRKGSVEGLDIPVSLERIRSKDDDGSRRYVLKIDDELRELLAAGARERERHTRGTKKVRARKGRFGDLVFTQRYTTFDRMNESEGRKSFWGFAILMWLGVGFFLLKTAAENYRAYGHIFGIDILSIMFRPHHLFDCLLTDAIMFYGSTLWNVPLQKAVQKGAISWDRTAWILQSIWQFVYIYFIISYTLYKEWPWIQTVFLVLHCIVMLMKQHSYAFYNGYLSEVYKRRCLLETKLEQMKDCGAQTSSAEVELNPTLGITYRDRRRSSAGQLDIAKLPSELSPRQATHFAKLLQTEIEACDSELSLEATNSPRVTYPENLTYKNYFEYIHFPTVLYELCYPRTLGIDWSYVAEKTVATFGVLGIMVLVSQQSIYPVVMYCNSLRGLPITDRLAEFPWILLQLVFPFMMCYLCVWYLIWELILNLLGELTRFADRGFYGDWWNSVTWDQFARDWNTPVHQFLLRHVYHSSISTFQISRENATLITFLISSVVHELVMWCIFGKLRGYLFAGQMLQLPLVALSRTRFMRGRMILGNVLFWVGIWTGPSFLSASYLIL